MELKKLNKISEYEWEIPRSGDMRVPARLYASEQLIEEMDEKVAEQAANVAGLPGIVKYAIALPDAHWGYGFPIGGVGAFDAEAGGVVSIGGVGFDVNCGVRTMRTNLKVDDIKKDLEKIVDELFLKIPAGVGSKGHIGLNHAELRKVMLDGAQWVIKEGYGSPEDTQYIEEGGRIEGANPDFVSQTAIERESRQVGTLGSGNHYLEIQYIKEIFDTRVAQAFGLAQNQVVITFHCGSRGFGHQVASDYLKTLAAASRKYQINIKDREMVCAPIRSPEGQQYLGATIAAINYAFANRQVIYALTKEVLEKLLPGVGISLLYDVGHNTVKQEKHVVDGSTKKIYVHRKGSTRGFGPGRHEVPEVYRAVGQPIIIGGSMGDNSYILVGTELGMEKTFGSTVHGAGRAMSRTQAKKHWRGGKVIEQLKSQGIYVRCKSLSGVAEEAPLAYKRIDTVIEAIHKSGLSKKVALLQPIGNIKG